MRRLLASVAVAALSVLLAGCSLIGASVEDDTIDWDALIEYEPEPTAAPVIAPYRSSAPAPTPTPTPAQTPEPDYAARLGDEYLVTYDDIQTGRYKDKIVCIDAVVLSVEPQYSNSGDWHMSIFELAYPSGDTYIVTKNMITDYDLEDYPDAAVLRDITAGDLIRYATTVLAKNSFGMSGCCAADILDHVDLSEYSAALDAAAANHVSALENSIRRHIEAEYSMTTIDRITINEDYGTDLDGDYVALVYLTWTQKNDGDLSKTMLTMYSDDLAAWAADNCPDVQELAVFWTVPYLDADAKRSYERRDGGMYSTDSVFGSAFG